MKINTRSWHYRYLVMFEPLGGSMPTNLCDYCWSLVWAIVFGGPIVVVMCYFYFTFLGFAWTVKKCFQGISKIIALFPERQERPPKPLKEIGFIGEMWKALKGRYCPIITYTE